ncbi:hypothetical protein ACP3PD_07955 [Enterobacter ludwigii]|uniref:hypothetical protein n=1 Tax=Enterobacter cloacae complex TaxID=354276 RepID=UPI000AB4AC9B|nr:hypothetical protein [Enterobacter ludwigii]
MRIKEHLDKIRLSHLLCLFCGALIPIYADVLFLHEINSSTVSALMDTIMAIAAISAALSVRHWIRDRVKNKGFEHAQSILIDIHTLNQSYFDLQIKYKKFAFRYMNGEELKNEQINILKLESDALLVLCNKVQTKILEIYVALKTLNSWDMSCKNEDEYIDFLKKIETGREKIESKLLTLDLNSHIVRLKQWKDWKDEFSETVEACSNSYKDLDKRFVTAFSYAPPSE